ncbi:MAG TPA: matrixin family metalloprotease, partial [Phycisphaerae bacterium]|nr:matrixin family metalloprotease [Phycisphaerae bacterium]
WANFRGEIAVNSVAAKGMNSAEIYAAAVHEIGHMLGLKHNANVHSVMYFLDVEGSEVLDSRDISDLSRRHELRPVILAADFVPIQESSGK